MVRHLYEHLSGLYSGYGMWLATRPLSSDNVKKRDAVYVGLFSEHGVWFLGHLQSELMVEC